uniref:PARP catalytic domain-containing protein n=1 Tax=Ditylenchus dipsaci TaxID=166011 RepID=A0A915DPB3_9BILA
MEVMASKRPEGSQEPEVTQVPEVIQVPEVTIAPIVAEIGNVSGVMEVVQNAPLIVPLTKSEMIRKVVEFTNCSELVAKAALYESDNNSDEAINSILDRPATPNSPNKVQDNHSRAMANYDEAGPSTSTAKSATVAKLREMFTPKIVQGKELTKNFLDEFMLDRIVQDYLAEKDDAQELTNYFDFGWNRDFRNMAADPPLKGGKLYTKPYGCMRYSISVVGKYPPNDNWLGGNGVPNEEEWPVAYHGTKEINVLDILVNGFKLEKGKRFAYGKGIYCTPDPRTALGYANDFQFQDKNFKLILQCRVDPTKLKIVANGQNVNGLGQYWTIPDGSCIRPYAICVYDQQAATLAITGTSLVPTAPLTAKQIAKLNSNYGLPSAPPPLNSINNTLFGLNNLQLPQPNVGSFLNTQFGFPITSSANNSSGFQQSQISFPMPDASNSQMYQSTYQQPAYYVQPVPPTNALDIYLQKQPQNHPTTPGLAQPSDLVNGAPPLHPTNTSWPTQAQYDAHQPGTSWDSFDQAAANKTSFWPSATKPSAQQNWSASDQVLAYGGPNQQSGSFQPTQASTSAIGAPLTPWYDPVSVPGNGAQPQGPATPWNHQAQNLANPIQAQLPSTSSAALPQRPFPAKKTRKRKSNEEDSNPKNAKR